MADYYLAVDIGASGGRHMLGSLINGKLHIEEVHRFKNSIVRRDGHLCWDLEALLSDIKTGLKRCKEIGKIPVSMGIDTWAVDYVLLDKDRKVLGKTYAYRDHRTDGMDKEVYKLMSGEELYKRTGIQNQIFNTIYQLMAIKKREPELMEQAESLLMLPDYFHYLLTGIQKTEYTNATTTQLVNSETRGWDMEVIGLLGYKKDIFGSISMPGTEVGEFAKEIAREVGFSCKVILPATHDTASAVMAVPSTEDGILYISSGTWSLMGTEQAEANISMKSMDANLTNEGGYDYKYRFLKNIMGLWMIQSVQRELKEEISFEALCKEASEAFIDSVVDCNDRRFLAPGHMIGEIAQYCEENNLKVPETAGEYGAVIYNSLAKCYGDTVKEIESITEREYRSIYIVGGGSKADYLNQLTAKYTKKVVYAGPGEATAIGNLLAQMIQAGIWKDLEGARECVSQSFEIKKYDDSGGGRHDNQKSV